MLGFGRLVLGSKPGDYGEMRFYTGSCSSSELDSTKEESYRLARALGVSSDADLACDFNFCDIGLLPPDRAKSEKFSKYCFHFHIPKVQRDLLEVEDAKLAEASEYHTISLSCFCNHSRVEMTH